MSRVKKIPGHFFRSGAIMAVSGNELMVAWGKPRWTREAETDFCFYFPDFFLREESPYLIFEHNETVDLKRFRALLGEYRGKEFQWQISSKREFKREFTDLKNLLSEGFLHKAVIYLFARCFSFFGDEELKNTLRSVIGFASLWPLYPYGFWLNGRGLLGATPEPLFYLKEGVLRTFSIAGSFRERGSLPKSPKLLREHALVAKGILESFAGLGKVFLGAPYLLALPKICHIAQSIEVKLSKRFAFDQIVRLLHPTPALGCYPKAVGERWLKERQLKYPRYRYGAPAGFVDNRAKISACLVAIRNIQWLDSHMLLGAGCGITDDSEFEDEWREIELKIEAVKEVLGVC